MNTSPKSAAFHFHVGCGLFRAGSLRSAEDAFLKAVNIDSRFDAARYQLGLVQFMAGRGDLALATWTPLATHCGDQQIRTFIDGFIALARDDLRSALRLFKTGIARNRSNLLMNASIARVVDAIQRLLALPAFDEDPYALLPTFQLGSTCPVH